MKKALPNPFAEVGKKKQRRNRKTGETRKPVRRRPRSSENDRPRRCRTSPSAPASTATGRPHSTPRPNPLARFGFSRW
jgi:hypothetical protein